MAIEPPVDPNAPLGAREERSRLRQTEFWAVIGAGASLLTGLTTLLAVVVAVQQLNESREQSLKEAAYSSWSAFNEASLANPELSCPDTDDKLKKLLSTIDPKSSIGATYQDRYDAYGNLMMDTAEQILQMPVDQELWRFRLSERFRCNAPAIRYLYAEGTYQKRYSCRLRHVISQALADPRLDCTEASG